MTAKSKDVRYRTNTLSRLRGNAKALNKRSPARSTQVRDKTTSLKVRVASRAQALLSEASTKRTTNVLGDRPPALDGSPTSTDEQVGSLCCQVAAPASKPESLQAHAVSVLPDGVQDSRAKGVRAERSHAVACQRVGRARKRSRASLGLLAVLRPSRGAKRRAQAAARRTRRCASSK